MTEEIPAGTAYDEKKEVPAEMAGGGKRPAAAEAAQDVKSMDLEELTQFATALGEKPFRAKQMYEWMHRRLAASWEEMTPLPAALRARLAEEAPLTVLTAADRRISKLDGTEKFLFRLPDGNVIESVLMRYRHGNSVCISSQVGCAMGCRFCASTIGGRVRSLRPSEMLEQVYRIQKISGERVSNVVVMGSGEPLENYENLVKFLRLLTDGNGLNISARSVTVSTCGIVPGIPALAREGIPVTLALSLHQADQEKREKLMPVAKKYPLNEVIDACRQYFELTGRRVTFEYSLVKGFNDSREDARRLSRLAAEVHAHVNLIPVNPIPERDYTRPSPAEVARFAEILEKNGVTATVRREMGADISGACGQLRRGYLKEQPGGSFS